MAFPSGAGAHPRPPSAGSAVRIQGPIGSSSMLAAVPGGSISRMQSLTAPAGATATSPPVPVRVAAVSPSPSYQPPVIHRQATGGSGVAAPAAQSAPPPAPSAAPPVAPQAAQSSLASENAKLVQSLEALRQTIRIQEEGLEQLRHELEAARTGESRATELAKVAQREVERLSDELRIERGARERAEAASADLHMAAQMARDAAWQERSLQTSNGSAALSRRGPPAAEVQHGGDSGTQSARQLGRGGGSSSRGQSPVNQRRGVLPANAAKDEVDIRLQDFQQRTQCGLIFRRMNRGWYAFRRADDPPYVGERNVELSIVNGKLMARLEPSSNEPGWNNGKLGGIERFVLSMSS
eukprot:TRINITY_DN8118_c1_g1_i1.p1 TRINITY_DN8118_c1_g1~~TRINITY_DN8118_c1_g1_i1.p1  ORF type:complete len:353 (+),score=71.24 TRINITY_DN8118_c1_g1_i1:148-1206(+)